MSDEKQEKILDAMLSNMALERSEMVSTSSKLIEEIDDIEVSFSKWNETSTKEFASSPIAMSKLLNKVEMDNTQSLASLKKVMDSFSVLLVSNQHEFDLDESDESVVAEEKNAQISIDNINKEFKTRQEDVSKKMERIFKTSKKEYDSVLASMAPAVEGSETSVISVEDMTTNIIPLLQQKNHQLAKQLELAVVKSRSVTNQWSSDKKQIESILQANTVEIESLKKQVKIYEQKIRYREQSDRDQNFLPASVSRIDYDLLVSEFEEYKAKASAELKVLQDEIALGINNMKTISSLESEVVMLKRQIDQRAQRKVKLTSTKADANEKVAATDSVEDLREAMNDMHDEFEEKFKSMEDEKNKEIQFGIKKINDLTTEIKLKDSKIEKLISESSGRGTASGAAATGSYSSDSNQKIDPNSVSQLNKLKHDYALVEKERDKVSKAFEQLSKGMDKMFTVIDKNSAKLEKKLEAPYEAINRLKGRIISLANGLGVKPPVFVDNKIPSEPFNLENKKEKSLRPGRESTGSQGGLSQLVVPQGMDVKLNDSTTELIISQFQERIRVLEQNYSDDVNDLNNTISEKDEEIQQKEGHITGLLAELKKVAPNNPIISQVTSARELSARRSATNTTRRESIKPRTPETWGASRNLGPGTNAALVQFEISDEMIDEITDAGLSAFKAQSGVENNLIACSNVLSEVIPEFVNRLSEIVQKNSAESNDDLINELGILFERSFHTLGVSLSDFILQGGVINKETVESNRETLLREEKELIQSASGGDKFKVGELDLTSLNGPKSSRLSRRFSRVITQQNDSTSDAVSSSSDPRDQRLTTRNTNLGSRSGRMRKPELFDSASQTSPRDEDKIMLANAESTRLRMQQANLASRASVNTNNSRNSNGNNSAAPGSGNGNGGRGGSNGPRNSSMPGGSNVKDNSINDNNGDMGYTRPSTVSSRKSEQDSSYLGDNDIVDGSDAAFYERNGEFANQDNFDYTNDDIGSSSTDDFSAASNNGSEQRNRRRSTHMNARSNDGSVGTWVDADAVEEARIDAAKLPQTKIVATYYDVAYKDSSGPPPKIKYEDIQPRPKSPHFYSVQEDLKSGELMYIGDVRNKNFDALMNKGFGPDKLIKITLIEHHIRYHGGLHDENESSHDRMQFRAMVMEAELLISELIVITPLEELARYKLNTDKYITKLQTFNMWQKIKRLKEDGIFLDILFVHRDVIDKCITAAGGWKAAMNSIRKNKNLFADTSIWPEFFRVQVLEFYRHSLFETHKSFEKKMKGHQDELDAMQASYEAKIAEHNSQVQNLGAEIVRLKEKKRGLKREAPKSIEANGELNSSESTDTSDSNSVMTIDQMIALVREDNTNQQKLLSEQEKLKVAKHEAEIKAVASQALMQGFSTSDVFIDDLKGEKVLSLEEKIKLALEFANTSIDHKNVIPESLKSLMEKESGNDKLMSLFITSVENLNDSDIIRKFHTIIDRLIIKFVNGDLTSKYILEMVLEGMNSWAEGFENDAMELFAVCLKTFQDDINIAIARDLSLVLNKAAAGMPYYINDFIHKISSSLVLKPLSSNGMTDIELESQFTIERKQREAFKEKINDNFKEMSNNFQQQVASSVAKAILSTVVETVDISIQTEAIIEVDKSSTAPGSGDAAGATTAVTIAPPVTILDSPDKESDMLLRPGSPSKDTENGDAFDLDNGSHYVKALPPGFFLVHVADNEVELCPGVNLVSPEKWPDCVIPSDVIYVYKNKDAPLLKGLKRIPRYVKAPRVEGFEAVICGSSSIELYEGANLIFGSQLPFFVTLPPGVVVLKLKLGCRVPTGLTIVQLSPILRVPPDFIMPPGVELVQIHTNMMLPPGIEVSQGVVTVENKTPYTLPFGLQFIKRTGKVDLPGYMTPLEQSSFQEEEISVHNQINEGCTIIKRPNGFQFGLGVEILHRPAGHCLPAGMSPVRLSEYPKGLKLTGLLELVQLAPRFDIASGCIINKFWQIIARPQGVRLMPNCYLMKYTSNQRADIRTLPNFIVQVRLPALPKGGTFPKNVICGKILPGVGFPIPHGFQLAPGITVLPLSSIRKSDGSESLDIKLPINAVLVHREPNSVLPAGYERGSSADLPAGALLEKNMEIILLSVRFEVPAGVKLGFGAMLGRNTQLCPDSILSRDLRVIEWPYGMILPPGTELVELAPRCDIPFGFDQVNVSPTNPFNVPLPPKSIMVKLPEFIKLNSTQVLSEQVEIVELNYDLKKVEDKSLGIKKFKKEEKKEEIATNLVIPDGTVLLQRRTRHQLVPSELNRIPKESLPTDLMKALTLKNGNTISAAGSKSDGVPDKKVFEVASLEPQYRLPPGVEIFKGVYILPTPPWLMLPSWTALVGMYNPYDFVQSNDDLAELSRFDDWRNQTVIAYNEIAIATTQPLPRHSVVINIPNKSSVYAWKSVAPGLEAVEENSNIWLPMGHYLVERPSKSTNLPPGFESGYSPTYPNAKDWYKFSPGIEVVHLLPSYHLPLGISLQSSLVLKKLFVLNDVDRYPPPIERLTSLCKLSSIIQFCPGQSLSPGCTVLPFPPSFLDYSNPLHNRLINSIPSNPTSNRIFDNKALVVFVCLDATAPGYFFPPEGCFEFPDASNLVSEHFQFLKLNSNITAVVVPEELLNNRDRMMQSSAISRNRALSGEGSSDRKRPVHMDSEDLVIHPRVKELRQLQEMESGINSSMHDAKKTTLSTEDCTREELVTMIDVVQAELDKIEVENTEYRQKCAELQRELNHTDNRLTRLQEAQASVDEQFRTFREEISVLKGEVVKRETGLSLKVKEMKDFNKKYIEMQERMAAQIGVLQDQVATWKDASADFLQEKAKFAETLLNKEKHLVERFEIVLNACKARYREQINDIIDQICQLSTFMVCTLHSSSNIATSSDGDSTSVISDIPNNQSEIKRLPTINSINTLADKYDEDEESLSKIIDPKKLLSKVKPNAPVPADAIADIAQDFPDEMSVLSEDSMGYQDNSKDMMSIQSISRNYSKIMKPPKKRAESLIHGAANKSQSSNSKASKETKQVYSVETDSLDVIDPASYEHMIRSDDRFILVNRNIDLLLESFKYNSDSVSDDPCLGFKDASFVKSSLQNWFDAMCNRVRDLIYKDRNKFRILTNANENQIKAFSKQCRSLNRNIEMFEKMLLDARKVDVRPVPESNDKLLNKIRDLETSIDILRETSLNSTQEAFKNRVDSIKSYRETDESLFFDILVLKKRLFSQEAIIQMQQQEARAENKISPQEIKAIQHNIKVMKSKLDDLLLQRSVVRKSMEDLMKVIIDDVHAYERVVHNILPPNIIESILKWGTHRGLLVEKRDDNKSEKSELLSLQLFARGSNSSDIDESSLGSISLSSQSQVNLMSKSVDSALRPSSNESNVSKFERFPQISSSGGSQFNDNASLSSMSQSSSLQSFGGRAPLKRVSPVIVKDAFGEDSLFMPIARQNGSIGTLPAASAQSHLVSGGLRKGKVKTSKKK